MILILALKFWSIYILHKIIIFDTKAIAFSYDHIPTLDVAPLDRYSESITDLVEHPIQLKPPDEPLQPQYIKVWTYISVLVLFPPKICGLGMFD